MRESLTYRMDNYIDAYEPHLIMQGIPIHPTEFEEAEKKYKGKYRGYYLRELGNEPPAGYPQQVRFW